MDIGFVLGLMSTIWAFRRRDGWSREQLEAHQTRALKSLRKYAYANSPFYRQFHNGLTDRPLNELPVLTKAMLMERFDDLVTDRAVHLKDVEAHLANLRDDEKFLGRYWVNTTSGSTGRRGIFLFNRAEWIAILASFARAHEYAGVKINLLHKMKMASVASTSPWHMSARIGATLSSWWLPALRLDAAEPMERMLERLNAWQPEILVAYASMTRILADEQRAGQLQISPRVIYTSSEVLTDDTRRLVEGVWGKRLFNQYAATETGEIAAECERHRGMHLYEDLVIAEVVDRDNQPVPTGEYGDKLLVTVLSSRTQPLIRYELSDSIRLSTRECPCGRPFVLVDGIQGRTEDMLSFPGKAGGEVIVNPAVFHRVMDMVPATGWQIIQEQDGLRVLVSGILGLYDDSSLTKALIDTLEERGVIVPPIAVQHVDSILRGAAGKAPLIKSVQTSQISESR